jgi:hypothetical protein
MDEYRYIQVSVKVHLKIEREELRMSEIVDILGQLFF